MNRLIKVFPVLAVLLSFLLLGVGVANAAIPTSSNWKIVSSQDPGSSDNNLTGLAVVSSQDIWATGYFHNDSSNVTEVLIEHWNGTQWSVVPGVNPSPSFNYLASVTAISSTNVWAVGYYMTANGVFKTLVERWNGTKWSVVMSPNPSSSANFLSSVTAISASNLWAVGNQVNSKGLRKTLTEHWNGSTWSVVFSPNIKSLNNALKSVAAVSGKNIWAVGDAFDDQGSYQTLIEHWNGSTWSIVSGAKLSSTFSHLYGVTAISATNVWAVGFYSSGIWKSLVEHWNGTSWKLVASPNPGTDSNVFNSVTAVSASSIWAVGYLLNSSGSARTLIEHWNGQQWNVISSPNVGSGSNYLAAVAHASDTKTTWAVGNYYDVDSKTHTLVENNG